MPASVLLNYKDGVYAIDSFSETDDPDKNVLTWMVPASLSCLTFSADTCRREHY
jgi:hypothetical protein